MNANFSAYMRVRFRPKADQPVETDRGAMDKWLLSTGRYRESGERHSMDMEARVNGKVLAKQMQERQDFLAFARDAQLMVRSDLVRSALEPAPDIEAEFEDGSRVAFELGDLNAEGRHRSWSLLETAPKLMRETLQSMSASEAETFKAKFHGTWVTLGLTHQQNATKPKLTFQRGARDVLRLLMDLPTGFSGDIREAYGVMGSPDAASYLSRVQTLLGQIDSLSLVYISKPFCDAEVSFKANAGGRVEPLQSRVLEDKVKKSYQTELPVELLLTVRMGHAAHLGEVERLCEMAVRTIAGSPYRRIWLHERLTQQATILAER